MGGDIKHQRGDTLPTPPYTLLLSQHQLIDTNAFTVVGRRGGIKHQRGDALPTPHILYCSPNINPSTPISVG